LNTLQTNSKNPASSKTATPDIERIYHYTNEEVLAMLESSPAGLSSQQIKERQDRDGKNIIKEAKEKSILLVFLSNFVSVMAILLWVSGFIAILARMPELGIAIWCVNLINGVFSFWQEYQAGKATEALKKMLPSYSRVIRDGTEQQILAEDLVVGDIILVTEGDKISADARLLEATDLQVNQSTLTGESNPVRKICGSDLSGRCDPFGNTEPDFRRNKRLFRKRKSGCDQYRYEYDVRKHRQVNPVHEGRKKSAAKRVGQTDATDFSYCLGVWRIVFRFSCFLRQRSDRQIIYFFSRNGGRIYPGRIVTDGNPIFGDGCSAHGKRACFGEKAFGC